MTPCITAAGRLNSRGYGRCSVEGKRVLAHRASYAAHHNLSLSDLVGQVVRHKCDNPACVNPEHLEPGSQADNMRDMVRRGRSLRCGKSGELNINAKLTLAQVESIRAEYVPRSPDRNQAKLAEKYGVSQFSISVALRGLTWSKGTE